MTQESWFRRIWRLITPELIYLALCYLIDIAAAGYWAFSMAGDYSQSNMDAFVAALSDKLIKYAMDSAVGGGVFQYSDPASDVL